MSLTRPPSRLVIALRKSALSLCHAEYIRARLLQHYPACEIVLRGITTQGDRIVDKSLADVGGKGLFIEEIEAAMLEGRADFAVHSCKDMPMVMAENVVIAAFPEREDPRDALVSNKYPTLDSLPAGAIVGTSSPRREAQLRARNAALEIRLLRGNVNTRVRRLDEGNYDAIVLAAAGLNRLELGHRISSILAPEEFLPAVGQGALALECPIDRTDLMAILEPLIHRPTVLTVTAERAFARTLSGNCHTPLAGHAILRDDTLWLRGLLASGDGSEIIRGELSKPVADVEAAEALGLELANDFLARGAARLCGR